MNDPRRRRARAKAESRTPVAALTADPVASDSHADDGGKEELPEVPVAAGVTAAELSGDSRFRRARELEREGDIGGAILIYQQLLLEEPDNIKARNNLGCLYDAQGKPILALEQYETARNLAPDNIDVLINIGDALVTLTKYDQAEREYRRAQKLDPARADVYVQLGILYFKRGLYGQAEVELKKAIELDAENGLAYFYRGESLNQLMRVDEALDSLLRSTVLVPTNARAFYLMGILYDKKRMPEQAMSMYRRARELSAK